MITFLAFNFWFITIEVKKNQNQQVNIIHITIDFQVLKKNNNLKIYDKT